MTGDYALTLKPSRNIINDHVIYLAKTVSVLGYISKQVQLQKPLPFLFVLSFMLFFIDISKPILMDNQFSIEAALLDNRS